MVTEKKRKSNDNYDNKHYKLISSRANIQDVVQYDLYATKYSITISKLISRCINYCINNNIDVSEDIKLNTDKDKSE